MKQILNSAPRAGLALGIVIGFALAGAAPQAQEIKPAPAKTTQVAPVAVVEWVDVVGPFR